MESNLVSASKARKTLSDLINQVKYQEKQIYIGRYGKAEAMLVPIPEGSQMQNFHKHIEDIRAKKNLTIKYDSDEFSNEYKKLAKKYDLDLIILFGSHASNKIKPNSDIDIAFKGVKKISFAKEQNLYADLVKLFERDDIDLINLHTHSDIVLLYEVFTSGKVLFEKNNWLFPHLRMCAWFDFQDFKRYFKMSKKATLNRVKKIQSII